VTKEKKDEPDSLGDALALPAVQLMKVLKVLTAALVAQGAVDGPRLSRQLLSGGRRLRKKPADQVMFAILDNLALVARVHRKGTRRTPKR
jgi:hypothetical protein